MSGAGSVAGAWAGLGVEGSVGGTPLVEVGVSGLGSVRLWGKLESMNPLSSVKDRAVLFMVRAAEEAGLLPARGGTVVECSSGSTGISLAGLCARRGHRCVIVMPDNASVERRRVLQELGAEVVLVPHGEGLLAAWAFAEEFARSVPGAWVPHQDRNPANVRAHYETTGPEIWAGTGGCVDVLVCGVGTGGTLTGTARFLKERRGVHVVAVEPARSAVLSGGAPGPHGIPGIGAGYVSPITDVSLIDEVVAVGDEEAVECAREVTRVVGVPVGVSSGAAVWAARAVAADPRWAGKTMVTVLPDSGERYLSAGR
ncbi:PLP-dependent cysteine synthase family protein [Streptomyces sp. NPDC057638]|uniref:PLP-dependent cysteine synthase family protein n=1 Tax=Streptomyces sp. NPDC057638 TaxID=3346190 RepID=UPI0036C48732